MDEQARTAGTGPTRSGSDAEERVDRRGFLRLSATLAALSATGGTALAAARRGGEPDAPSFLPPLTDAELTAHLARLDDGLAQIAASPIFGGIVPPAQAARPEVRRVVDNTDRLARRLVSSLYFVGMYNDLSPADRERPAVRQRVEREGPALDAAVFDGAAKLASLSDRELADLQRVLRETPDLDQAFADDLTSSAKELGVPFSQRLKTRKILRNLGERLRTQPPELLVGEYVDKVTKVAVRCGQESELERRFAAVAAADATWRLQSALAADPPTAPDAEAAPAVAGAPPVEAVAAPAPAAPEPPALEPEDRAPRGRSKTVRAGVIMMAVGGGAVGAGALFLGVGWGADVSLGLGTFGAVLAGLGLLVLLIGLIVYLVGKSGEQTEETS
jgi:hypothetical protein